MTCLGEHKANSAVASATKAERLQSWVATVEDRDKADAGDATSMFSTKSSQEFDIADARCGVPKNTSRLHCLDILAKYASLVSAIRRAWWMAQTIN